VEEERARAVEERARRAMERRVKSICGRKGEIGKGGERERKTTHLEKRREGAGKGRGSVEECERVWKGVRD
jgi:hypothetical protein